MAVEIKIDLDSSKAHGKIEALETRLKAVNDSLDLDFNIDEDLKDNIQKLTEELKKIEIDVDYDDLERAAALKSMLQGDIDTDLNVNTDKALQEIQDSLDPPDGSGIDHDGQARKFAGQKGDDARFSRFMDSFKRWTSQPRMADGTFGPNSFKRDFLEGHRTSQIGDHRGVGSYAPGRLSRMQDAMRRRRDMDFRTSGLDFNIDSLPDLGRDDYITSPSKDGKMLSGLKKRFKSLIPSMNAFYQLLAISIPYLVVMGTQLAGIASAMGSVAVAGGAILALGLVGHGDDMASSWENAKEQLSTLKKELFETFQPTMQTFAPIQERFFDTLPSELDSVASAMEGLTAYSGTLFAALRGISDWVTNGIRGMVKYEDILSQLAMRFGELLGTNINQFFRFITKEAYTSQGMLIKVGSAVKDLIVGAYNLFKVVVRITAVFAPLIGVLSYVAGLLDNKLIVGILTFSVVAGATIYTVLALSNAFAVLGAVSVSGLIPALISLHGTMTMYIHQALATVMANHALAASIASVISVATLGVGAILGLGAALSAVNGMNAVADVRHQMNGGAGGYSGGSIGGGGAGGGTTQNIVNEGDTYNMEVNGDIDNPTEQGLRDIVVSEGKVSSTRGTPTIGGE